MANWQLSEATGMWGRIEFQSLYVSVLQIV